MQLNVLYPANGSKHKRKMLGRGTGSAHGGSSTRGGKGQTARSGEKAMPGFEGGQMPLLRRIPKRGFSNKKFSTEYSLVSLKQLEEKFDTGAEITPALLFKNKVVKKRRLPVKVVGGAGLSKKFNVQAHAFTKGAEEKISAAGGSVKRI